MMREQYYLEALTFTIAYLIVTTILIIMLVSEIINSKKQQKTKNQITIK